MKEYLTNKSIIERFENIVKKNPNNIAVRLEFENKTYQQFNQDVKQFSRILIASGVKLQDIVAIELNRSYEMLYAIFAVLKIGAVYLPIDPDYPPKRKHKIQKNSQFKYLISKTSHDYSSKIITITPHITEINKTQQEDIKYNINSGRLAYIIYTSGTTGEPKGVMVDHKALLNRIVWMQEKFQISTEDIIFHKTHPCFDVSIWEVLLWAISGAGVVLLPPKQESNILLIHKMITKYAITIAHFVPSVLNIYLMYLSHHTRSELANQLRYVFSSGEALSPKTVENFYQLFPENIALINLYGPTEAAIDVTYHICRKNKTYEQFIPIGKPISNVKLYVLNNQLEPVGRNERGGLFISGVCLAYGYLNQPDVTRKFFIRHQSLPNIRLYKTGDIVRFNENGELEFLGREDSQIKLRGLRVELSEIEYYIKKHPLIFDATVLCINTSDENQVIMAYIVASATTDLENELKDILHQNLPDYMIPNKFIFLNSLPIKTNGKLDKQQLESLALA